MKKILFLSGLSVLLFTACKKNADDNIQEQLPEGTVIKSGALVSDNKATSGIVKVVQGANGNLKLVFENLSTGNGPDVGVWLSPNINASSYTEVGPLKAFTGTFSYDLNPNADFTTNNRVLIWCVDFSLLFGHAVLQ